MNILAFIVIFFLLQGICVWVGKNVSKKMETQDDYFLAGRGIRFFPLLMTLIATQIGGGLVLGSCEEAYRYGWAVVLYPLGASLGLFVLALGIGKRLSFFKVGTVAQIFEVAYGSSKLKKIASLLSILSLFFILVAQITASKKFMVSLGVNAEWIFIAFWAMVILYTVVGGLKAVVATDVIQALFFLAIFLIAFLFTFFSTSSAATMATETFSYNSEKLTGWLLMPLLFMVIEQDMGQRCFAAKSAKTVTLATGVAALITILTCLIPIFFGVLGKKLGVATPVAGSTFMEIVSLTTNPWMTALVGCAILAAIISTADSLMNAISSNLTLDFSLFKNLRGAKFVTTGIALLAIGISYQFNNVVDLLILSYELSVSALFVPLLMALFFKKGDPLTATLSILFGAVSFTLSRFIDYPFLPHEIINLFCSLIGFLFGKFIINNLLIKKVVD